MNFLSIFVTVKHQNPDPRLGGLLGESGVQAANFLSKILFF